MANAIKPKRSSVASNVPTTSNLASGEIGVNMADQKIYINNGTSVVQIGTGKLSGAVDVTLSGLTTGQTLQWNGTAWVNGTGGSGSVTGVTATSPVASSGGTAPVISLSSGYGDTQNPYASKTANYVLASPNGSAGAPTFRALVASDIPTLNQNTTGSAGSVAWSGVTGKPTTLSGYGITDAQPSSTAITTSNIGSQSVNYATSAGSATSATTSSSCSGNAVTAASAFRAISAGSYGSGEVYGSNGGWSGVRFNTPNSVFMVRDTDSYSGIYKSNSTWVWAFDQTGSLVTGTVPGSSVSGAVSSATYATSAGTITSQANSATITASSGVNASQIVQRDANGYIYANYINHNTSESENPAINSVFVSNGDGWTRKASASYFVSTLGLAQQSAGGVVLENGQTISSNYTMTSGKNGTSAGPITIATGVTVTIPTGSNWVIV